MGIVFELISSSLLRMINHTRYGVEGVNCFHKHTFDPQMFFSLLSPSSKNHWRARKCHKNKNSSNSQKKERKKNPLSASQLNIHLRPIALEMMRLYCLIIYLEDNWEIDRYRYINICVGCVSLCFGRIVFTTRLV